MAVGSSSRYRIEDVAHQRWNGYFLQPIARAFGRGMFSFQAPRHWRNCSGHSVGGLEHDLLADAADDDLLLVVSKTAGLRQPHGLTAAVAEQFGALAHDRNIDGRIDTRRESVLDRLQHRQQASQLHPRFTHRAAARPPLGHLADRARHARAQGRYPVDRILAELGQNGSFLAEF